MDITHYLNNFTSPVWLTATILSLVFYIVFFSLQKILIKQGGKRAAKTNTQLDDLAVELLTHIKKYFLLALSIYLGCIWIKVSAHTRNIFDKAIIIIGLIQVAQLAGIIINFWITKHLKSKSEQNLEMASTVGLISIVVKAITYSIILLLALNNLGVDVTALIAGLGVGGIAIALAMQNILTDLFSSLTIVLDKPFIVGDFIIVNDLMGTVENIGLKTTRVRSISGEQLIFGNGDLLQSRIKNYKRMSERRVVQNLTVTYQTLDTLLDEIPVFVKQIVEKRDKVRFDRCHFLRFQDSSLEFELVYWVLGPEFNDYADRAHAINVEIFRKFAEMKIDFAYPTRTLHIESRSE